LGGELALENITWPEAPPEGTYTVYVELFRGPKAVSPGFCGQKTLGTCGKSSMMAKGWEKV